MEEPKDPRIQNILTACAILHLLKDTPMYAEATRLATESFKTGNFEENDEALKEILKTKKYSDKYKDWLSNVREQSGRMDVEIRLESEDEVGVSESKDSGAGESKDAGEGGSEEKDAGEKRRVSVRAGNKRQTRGYTLVGDQRRIIAETSETRNRQDANSERSRNQRYKAFMEKRQESTSAGVRSSETSTAVNIRIVSPNMLTPTQRSALKTELLSEGFCRRPQFPIKEDYIEAYLSMDGCMMVVALQQQNLLAIALISPMHPYSKQYIYQGVDAFNELSETQLINNVVKITDIKRIRLIHPLSRKLYKPEECLEMHLLCAKKIEGIEGLSDRILNKVKEYARSQGKAYVVAEIGGTARGTLFRNYYQKKGFKEIAYQVNIKIRDEDTDKWRFWYNYMGVISASGLESDGPAGAGSGMESDGPAGAGSGMEYDGPAGAGSGMEYDGSGMEYDGPAGAGSGIVRRPDVLPMVSYEPPVFTIETADMTDAQKLEFTTTVMSEGFCSRSPMISFNEAEIQKYINAERCLMFYVGESFLNPLAFALVSPMIVVGKEIEYKYSRTSKVNKIIITNDETYVIKHLKTIIDPKDCLELHLLCSDSSIDKSTRNFATGSIMKDIEKYGEKNNKLYLYAEVGGFNKTKLLNKYYKENGWQRVSFNIHIGNQWKEARNFIGVIKELVPSVGSKRNEKPVIEDSEEQAEMANMITWLEQHYNLKDPDSAHDSAPDSDTKAQDQNFLKIYFESARTTEKDIASNEFFDQIANFYNSSKPKASLEELKEKVIELNAEYKAAKPREPKRLRPVTEA